MGDRPNFILFVTDQHRADYLGCYGHPTLRTPNIDALAQDGVLFESFYATSPVCMPNRASLMTGRMPSSHGVWTNGTPLSKSHVTFVEVLRDAGYDTALIGKSHLQNFSAAPPTAVQPPAPDGFIATSSEHAAAFRSGLDGDAYGMEQPEFWADPDNSIELPFYGFDHVDLVTGHGDGAGGDYARWLREQGVDPDELVGADNQLPHDYSCPQAVRTSVPVELYTTSYITAQATKWLADRSESEKPFFLMVSWPDPHHPFNPPGEYWDMYDPDDMEIPAAFTDVDWTPPDFVEAAIDRRAAGKAFVNGFGSFAITAREAQEARALTCGMIALIDDCVGTVSAAVADLDLTGNTITAFTADHGDNLGDHKLLLKGAEQYEQITRVPFIWADPDGPSGERESGIGQTHDIGVSILQRAQVQQPWGLQGRALPFISGECRDAALIQFDLQRGDPLLGTLPRVHTARTARWRLSIFDGIAGGELYDLETDPDELRNRFDDPAVAEERAHMFEVLARLEIAACDRVPLPRGLA